MSFQAMAWAVDQPVKGLGKLVLLLLANYTGADGICFPSQKEIAAHAGITDRAVRKWMEVLEAEGYIQRTERRRYDGTRTTDYIVLALSKQAEPASASEPIKRNETPLQAEPRSGPTTFEPITEPITERTAREELGEVLDEEHAKAVVEHRQRIGKPLTPYAARQLAKKFRPFPNPNDAADEMLANGWQGFDVRWLENRRPNGTGPPNGHAKPKSGSQEMLDALRTLENQPATTDAFGHVETLRPSDFRRTG